MKRFKFSMIAMAFVIAIAASAFSLPLQKQAMVTGERFFAYTAGNEDNPGSYMDLGVSFDPENEGCPEGSDLCVLLIESTGNGSTGDPYLPEQNALTAIQGAIGSAKTATENDEENGIYLKAE